MEGFNPYLLIVTLAAMWSVAGGGLLFQAVGIGRAARRYTRESRFDGRSGLWGVAAVAVVLLWAGGLVYELVKTGVPAFAESWRMAFEGDPAIPDYSIRLMHDGQEAEIAGGFKFGLARDATRIFATAPNLKVVHLNSGGGRLGEAEKLAAIIFERQLVTYSSASCSSACTIAFLAGRERWLKQGAKLGFHHESFAGNENFDNMRRLLIKAGLPSAFAERAVAPSASTMWYPTTQELLDAHAISGVVDTYRFAASGYGTFPDRRAFEEQLRHAPLFEAIEASEPQTFRAIVDAFHRAYMDGVSEGRIMDELRGTKVAPLILAHMDNADDQLLADYAALMADQYEALGRRDATACFEYSAKGATTNLVNMLPEPLKTREIALSEAVLRATQPRKQKTDISVQAVYRTVFEKLSEQFGPTQVQLLADPAKVPAVQYATYCKLAVGMFRAISALPREQAGAVMSQIFSSVRARK